MSMRDPIVSYGIMELLSRLGIDSVDVSRDFEQQSEGLQAVIVVDGGNGHKPMRDIINESRCSVILVGPSCSEEVDALFGIETVGQCDSFPDVSGWMTARGVPEPIPIFYSIPVFRKLEAATQVFAETRADGVQFPSVILKRDNRKCLVRIGPQLFRSTAFLLTVSGLRPFSGKKGSSRVVREGQVGLNHSSSEELSQATCR